MAVFNVATLATTLLTSSIVTPTLSDSLPTITTNITITATASAVPPEVYAGETRFAWAPTGSWDRLTPTATYILEALPPTGRSSAGVSQTHSLVGTAPIAVNSSRLLGLFFGPSLGLPSGLSPGSSSDSSSGLLASQVQSPPSGFLTVTRTVAAPLQTSDSQIPSLFSSSSASHFVPVPIPGISGDGPAPDTKSPEQIADDLAKNNIDAKDWAKQTQDEILREQTAKNNVDVKDWAKQTQDEILREQAAKNGVDIKDFGADQEVPEQPSEPLPEEPLTPEVAPGDVPLPESPPESPQITPQEGEAVDPAPPLQPEPATPNVAPEDVPLPGSPPDTPQNTPQEGDPIEPAPPIEPEPAPEEVPLPDSAPGSEPSSPQAPPSEGEPALDAPPLEPETAPEDIPLPDSAPASKPGPPQEVPAEAKPVPEVPPLTPETQPADIPLPDSAPPSEPGSPQVAPPAGDPLPDLTDLQPPASPPVVPEDVPLPDSGPATPQEVPGTPETPGTPEILPPAADPVPDVPPLEKPASEPGAPLRDPPASAPQPKVPDTPQQETEPWKLNPKPHGTEYPKNDPDWKRLIDEQQRAVDRSIKIKEKMAESKKLWKLREEYDKWTKAKDAIKPGQKPPMPPAPDNQPVPQAPIEPAPPGPPVEPGSEGLTEPQSGPPADSSTQPAQDTAADGQAPPAWAGESTGNRVETLGESTSAQTLPEAPQSPAAEPKGSDGIPKESKPQEIPGKPEGESSPTHPAPAPPALPKPLSTPAPPTPPDLPTPQSPKDEQQLPAEQPAPFASTRGAKEAALVELEELFPQVNAHVMKEDKLREYVKGIYLAALKGYKEGKEWDARHILVKIDFWLRLFSFPGYETVQEIEKATEGV